MVILRDVPSVSNQHAVIYNSTREYLKLNPNHANGYMHDLGLVRAYIFVGGYIHTCIR